MRVRGCQMRILIAGASGAIGRQLVPRLVAAGHEVTGISRGPGVDVIEGLGAHALVADALDREAVVRAVTQAEPDALVHQLTAIAAANPRHLDRDFALTNRLRTQGTDNLLAAARAAGVQRFIAQSFAGLSYQRSGTPVKTEVDPLDSTPPANMRETIAAIHHLESAVLGAEWTEGLVLRYGWFYGPGTAIELEPPAGAQVAAVRNRKLPLIGNGTAVWSFVHVADAAEGTLAALTLGAPGIYNIVDDDPTPVSEWLPALARAAGAKKPLRLPVWLARLIGGAEAVAVMTETRGASNAKARRELGWQPAHPSLRRELAAIEIPTGTSLPTGRRRIRK